MVLPDNASTVSNQISKDSPARDVNTAYQLPKLPGLLRHRHLTNTGSSTAGCVEAGVRIIAHDVFDLLARTMFIDLNGINQSIADMVNSISDRVPFRYTNISRRQLFIDAEKEALLPRSRSYSVFGALSLCGRHS